MDRSEGPSVAHRPSEDVEAQSWLKSSATDKIKSFIRTGEPIRC